MYFVSIKFRNLFKVAKIVKFSTLDKVYIFFVRTIGVVGIDATLEEIENLLMNDRWGSVYAFLINSAGETIFHPLLRPSSEVRSE